MDLSKLNDLMTFLPRKKLSDLYPLVKHEVTLLRKVNTKYGEKVVARLNDEFEIFLPKPISKALVEDPVLFEQVQTDSRNGKLLIVMDKTLRFENIS